MESLIAFFVIFGLGFFAGGWLGFKQGYDDALMKLTQLVEKNKL